MPSDLYYKYKNIYLIPSVHSTLEFANIVRNAFFEVKPSCMALELPEQMSGAVLKGIRRLPYLSAVTFPDIDNTYHFIPIHPCDSIIEGARLADEFGKSLYFIDKDIRGLVPPGVDAPDTYYATKIGLKSYVDTYLKYVKKSDKDSIQYLRELYMAHRVRVLSYTFDRVMFVYGMYHHERILDFLKRDEDLAGEVTSLIDYYELRRPELFTEHESIELRHIPQESYFEMLGTMPYEMYLYELGRKGLGSFHLDIELPPEKLINDNLGLVLKKFLKISRKEADKLRNMPSYSGKADSYDYLHEIVFQARKLYNREWNDLAPMGKLALVLQFARNYALVSDRLVPTPYILITSAKNIVNDDFAWEFSRLLNFYPFFENEGDLDEILSMNGVTLMDEEEAEIKPHLPMRSWILKEIPLKKRPREKNPGEWKKVWKAGRGLVSYPPEDIIIENFFDYLRKKAKKRLEENHTRSVEFKGSILDGIDIKETIRNLHINKIFVKEQIPVKGEVGSLVIIFDKDSTFKKYPFQITWYAEHENESDLAFYSTSYMEKLVGPGISKAEYGGLLSVFPPRGIFDVWRDIRLNKALDRKERLLLAGIMYADKKYVLYIAPDPPRPYMYSLAEHNGHHIMYIPLKDLSENTLKRVRVFHMLSDSQLRSIAGRYISFD